MIRDLEVTAVPTLHRATHGMWRRKIALLLFSMLVSLASAEVTARIFWRFCYGIPLRKPDAILYSHYPELRKLGERRPTHSDEFFDILFLGGSVLHKDWGSVEIELRERLAYLGHRNVRIFNLAVPGHTSRDSWLKYAALEDVRFDLVIFYHGINEATFNNAPPQVFREDYGHYSWYESVNSLAPYHRVAAFALPYTLHYLMIQTRSALSKDHYIPKQGRKDWIQYGRNLHSAVSFKRNLGAILNLASQRRDRVLLMTYAYYIPENYSLDAFKKQRLDYSLHRSPIELWGAPENVLAALHAHNEIVRSMVAQDRHILFADQASLMRGSARYFNDPVHLTSVGSAMFVDNILPILFPIMTEWASRQQE